MLPYWDNLKLVLDRAVMYFSCINFAGVYSKSKKSRSFMTSAAGHFPKILGTATLNEKGQLVVPVEARNSIGLTAGSKVVIMSKPGSPALILLKAEEVEAMVKDLAIALDSQGEKN